MNNSQDSENQEKYKIAILYIHVTDYLF